MVRRKCSNNWLYILGLWYVFLIALLMVACTTMWNEHQGENIARSSAENCNIETKQADVKETGASLFIEDIGNQFNFAPFCGQCPYILYQNKCYYWDWISTHFSVSQGEVFSNTINGDSRLPEGNIKVGELLENMQIYGIETEMHDSVYANQNTPEVIYVWIESEPFISWWDEEGRYVRFVTETMQKKENTVMYGKVLYRVYGCKFYELPDGYERKGKVTYIGSDAVPENNMETNAIRFSEGEVNVYACEQDSDQIIIGVSTQIDKEVYFYLSSKHYK